MRLWLNDDSGDLAAVCKLTKINSVRFLSAYTKQSVGAIYLMSGGCGMRQGGR